MSALGPADFEAGTGPVSRWALRFSFLGGAVAWTFHLLLAYLVAEFGCLLGWDRARFIGLSAVVWIQFVVFFAMLGLAAWATWVSWRARERLRGGLAGRPGEHFTAETGLVSNLVFAGVIVVQAIPIFYFLRGC